MSTSIDPTRPTPLDMPNPRPVLPAQRVSPDIARIRLAGRQLHQALERAVCRMRLEGGSWADVGRALGTSRQAAWERFRYVDQTGVIELRVDAGGRGTFWSTALGEQVAGNDGVRALWAARDGVRAAIAAG